MPKPKKVEDLQEAEAIVEEIVVASEKDILVDLYEKMKTYNINSISDVEVKISRL